MRNKIFIFGILMFGKYNFIIAQINQFNYSLGFVYSNLDNKTWNSGITFEVNNRRWLAGADLLTGTKKVKDEIVIDYTKTKFLTLDSFHFIRSQKSSMPLRFNFKFGKFLYQYKKYSIQGLINFGFYNSKKVNFDSMPKYSYFIVAFDPSQSQNNCLYGNYRITRVISNIIYTGINCAVNYRIDAKLKAFINLGLNFSKEIEEINIEWGSFVTNPNFKIGNANSIKEKYSVENYKFGKIGLIDFGVIWQIH